MPKKPKAPKPKKVVTDETQKTKTVTGGARKRSKSPIKRTKKRGCPC